MRVQVTSKTSETNPETDSASAGTSRCEGCDGCEGASDGARCEGALVRELIAIAPAAATTFSAAPTSVVPSIPKAGSSRKPANSAPSVAPMVLAAYNALAFWPASHE